MGANSTRFLLNHVTFEDDAAPYVYKDAGWTWIDQNVAWAKAHGIHLIFNMHVPRAAFSRTARAARCGATSATRIG